MRAFDSKGTATFELIGKAKITKYTFDLEKPSKNSDWIRNVLGLIVDCGDGNEVIANMSGGYGSARNNVVYVHGKKEALDKDGNVRTKEINGKTVTVMTDDYENMYTIAWEDRLNEDVLKSVGEGSFIKIGIQKDKDGKTFTQKFISAYDAIAFLEEHKDLIDGQVVRVNGDVKYNLYNGNVRAEKEIKSIFISAVEEDKFKAEFTQTILVDKKCVGKKDKDTGLYDVSAYVLESMKQYDGKEIPKELFPKNKKGKTKKSANIPIVRNFQIENEALDKMIFSKTKRDKLTEMIAVGYIVEGKQKEKLSVEDLDDDMKMLVESGMYTLEQIAETTAIKSERVQNWIINRPLIKMVGKNEDEKKPQMQIKFDKYDEDDVILTFLADESTDDEGVEEDIDEVYESDNAVDESDDDNAWLNELN